MTAMVNASVRIFGTAVLVVALPLTAPGCFGGADGARSSSAAQVDAGAAPDDDPAVGDDDASGHETDDDTRTGDNDDAGDAVDDNGSEGDDSGSNDADEIAPPICPADADCTSRECGPDLICGASCGDCAGNEFCVVAAKGARCGPPGQVVFARTVTTYIGMKQWTHIALANTGHVYWSAGVDSGAAQFPPGVHTSYAGYFGGFLARISPENEIEWLRGDIGGFSDLATMPDDSVVSRWDQGHSPDPNSFELQRFDADGEIAWGEATWAAFTTSRWADRTFADDNGNVVVLLPSSGTVQIAHAREIPADELRTAAVLRFNERGEFIDWFGFRATVRDFNVAPNGDILTVEDMAGASTTTPIAVPQVDYVVRSPGGAEKSRTSLALAWREGDAWKYSVPAAEKYTTGEWSEYFGVGDTAFHVARSGAVYGEIDGPLSDDWNPINPGDLVKWNADGTVAWIDEFSAGPWWQLAAEAPDGSVSFAGEFCQSVDLGGGELEPEPDPWADDCDNHFFVARFDAHGNHLWSVGYGIGDDARMTGLVVDPLGNTYASGYANCFTLDLGQDLPCAGDEAFLVKYAP